MPSATLNNGYQDGTGHDLPVVSERVWFGSRMAAFLPLGSRSRPTANGPTPAPT